MCFDILGLLCVPPSLRLMFVTCQVGMTRREGQECTGKKPKTLKDTLLRVVFFFLPVRKYINK